jgi:hypothetical protein
MVNEIAVAFADEKPPAEVIKAAIVHVPAATNVTTPVDELTVQTPVVELEYDFVPLPSVELFVDDVIVGGVALNAYEPEYEPRSIVSVRGVPVVNERISP